MNDLMLEKIYGNIKSIDLDKRGNNLIDFLLGNQFEKTCEDNQQFIFVNPETKTIQLILTGGSLAAATFKSSSRIVEVLYGQDVLDNYDPLSINRYEIKVEYVEETTIGITVSAIPLASYIIDTEARTRITNLETNETIYQIFEYVGTSTTGQVTVPTEGSIYDFYGDGILDAIVVEADANQNPTEVNSLNSSDEIVQVTSLDVSGNYVLDSAPVENACIIYYIKIDDEYKKNVSEPSIVSPGIPADNHPHSVITVAKNNGDFTSLSDAINSITDNSSSNRYTVSIAPGEYTIDNPIALKDFCNISAMGLRSVVLKPANPTLDMFTGASFTHLVGLVFSGNTGSSWVLNHSVSGSVFIQDCVLRDCSNGFKSTGVGSILEARTIAVNNPSATTTTTVIDVQAGKALIDDILFRSTSNITNGIKVSGAGTLVSIDKLTTTTTNLTTALELYDGAKVVGSGNNIGFCYDGLVAYGDNTDVRFDALKIEGCQNDGFRLDNVGTNVELALFATTVTQCVGLNFNILNPNCIVNGNGFTELNNAYIHPQANVYAYLLDITEDDEGLNILGELHVGTPVRSVESVFGGGDSYTTGMLVYTETELGAFTDVSSAARSASGSTFTFPGIVADNAIYMASSLTDGVDFLEHYGIKTKIDTVATTGSGEIVLEYWNGSAWTEFNAMEVQSGGSYYTRAKNYFTNSGSNHIRYNIELATDSWTKNDPMSLGTSYYWIRFRIKTAITASPIIQQFKLHTNRFEINPDGWIEYFGTARPIGQLGLSFAQGKPFEGNMQNQTLYVSQDIGFGGTSNKFTSTTDKIGVFGFLPFDCDTSSPLRLVLAGHANLTGTYGWTVRWAWVAEGDSLTYAEPGAPIANSKSLVVSKSVTVNQLSIFEASLDISEMVSRREGGYGDEIWISIQPTTLPANFSLAGSQVRYFKWCEGGHI